jgi:membrane fusion protein, multidrug efflux system
MQRKVTRGSMVLVAAVIAIGIGLAVWKRAALQGSDAAGQPEPAEVVGTATARQREYQPTTTSIGTVVALRSIVLRNELPGTVRDVTLRAGEIVEAGSVLVMLDTSVEAAELAAQRAEAELAETRLRRTRQLVAHGAIAVEEMEQAAAQQLVTRAQIERTQAVIARKTLRAPFRARVGIADVHPGQYLEQGTVLTTLQGVDDAVYVDFAVAQQVAADLRVGAEVEIQGRQQAQARIVAIDARIDAKTRNTVVRARLDAAAVLAPGASVRVRIAAAPMQTAVAIPTSALRRSPEGDHVFVVATDAAGKLRAQLRRVQAGTVLGDEVLIESGVSAGESIATAGSFKLRDAALVLIAAADKRAAGHAALPASQSTPVSALQSTPAATAQTTVNAVN